MDDNNLSGAAGTSGGTYEPSNDSTKNWISLTDSFGRVRFGIPSVLIEEIENSSSFQGFCLPDILLACLVSLLYRYTSQQELIGDNPAQTLRDLAQNLTALSSRAFDGKHFVSEIAVRDLPKNLGNPFVSESVVRFVYHVREEPAFDESSLLGLYCNVTTSANVDLEIAFSACHSADESENLHGIVSCRSEFWQEEWVHRFLEHFMNLLRSAIVEPNASICDISILSEIERHRLLVDFNDTQCEYPRDLCIHELFEQQVERTPDAIALIFEEQQLTYGELNERSNRMAQYLRSQGVQAETPVGLCLERSLDLVVSILGILKAGGTYVPLDADYPQERTLHMIQDAEVRVLISQSSLRSRLQFPCPVICIEDAFNEASLMPFKMERESPSNLTIAYVIYTSGSTGVPKGVQVSHASAVNLLSWASKVLFQADESCMIGIAPAIFDISIAEMFAPLIAGRTAVLVPKRTAEDASALISEIDRHDRCIVQATPATWASILDFNWKPQRCATVVSTGEALPSSTRIGLLDLGLRVLDLYGPTETTVWSTFHPVTFEANFNCIGRPISNTQVYVLDKRQGLMPIGIPGELFIGGDGLSNGYLNRPELTAERFIPNPFSDDPHSKLYRTGDLCRWRTDGTLEYMGRIDQQVKLRGFRIELGEIETVLATHPAVARCVVVLREDRAGDKKLVAYYTPTNQTSDGVLQPREFLGSVLPEYMIPTAFVQFDALPLTPTGKIDRKSLPAPSIHDIVRQEDYQPPRNRLEQQLLDIWSEVLGVEKIGIHDHFFALGGHSLMAARAIALIARKLNRVLSFRTLLEYPTIAKTAEHLMDSSMVREPSNELALSQDNESHWCGTQIPVSFPQRSLWVIDLMHGDQWAYNIPIAWEIEGRIHHEALREALLKTVQRHEPLRTVFSQDSQGLWQEVYPVDSWDLPVLDLASSLNEVSSEVRLASALDWIQQQCQTRFDLSKDLPLRTWLIKLSESSYILFLVVHHIAIDGWSIEVLKREIESNYAESISPSVDSGLIGTIGIPATHYRDYAQSQHAYAQSASLAEDLQYWRVQLSGYSDLDLPTDFARPKEFTFRGDSVQVEISPEQYERIESFCRSKGYTPHVVLLSIFQLLLSKQSGQSDIITAVPVGYRDEADWDRLVGYFINTLAIRSHLDLSNSFAKIVQQVQSTSAAAFDHRQAPFEVVVSELCKEPSRDRNPLAQALFQYMDFESRSIQIDSATINDLDLPILGARFDLEMMLQRRSDPETGKPYAGGRLYFCTDLWDKSTVQSWATRFKHWIDILLQHVETPLQSLNLLTSDELRELGGLEAGQTKPEFLDNVFCDLFDLQASRTPNVTAVSDHSSEFSYEDLQARSMWIAAYLRKHGVVHGERVAVLLDRSFDSIACLIGIWKAGGVYLPLDPSYPRERLEYFVRDSSPAYLITTIELSKAIEFPKEQTLVLDGVSSLADYQSNEIAGFPAVSLDDLAYVLYTSGSTGEPKGVQMPHRAIANLISWQNSHQRLSVPARTLQFAPKCFDVSIQEIASTLTTGGTLVLIDESRRIDPVSLLEYIDRHGIQRLFLPFVMIDALTQVAKSSDGQSLQDIVSAGESLQLTDRLRRFLTDRPGCKLHNHYGPTETHVVTQALIGLEDFAASSHASIGRPIPNCTCVILDREGRRVVRGAVGELYLSGACLASGYVNKLELTSERFVCLPDMEGFQGRFYRTGDLARWRYDGNLEFLGRGDTQVKYRGFRIELEEIETALRVTPGVSQCVVTLREERPGDKRLVAYYTWNGEDAPAVSEFREWLSRNLPEYMIPSAYVRLDRMPLTPSGKIDRKSLPAPDQQALAAEGRYTAPRNGLEEQLAQIWSEVLGVQPIGIHDNFFSLGGHSLLAVKLAIRVSDVFQIGIGVRQVFEEPTVAKIAHRIESMRSSELRQNEIKTVITPRNLTEASPLSYGQERLWFLEQLEGSLTAYNLSVAWRLRGCLDQEALRKATEAIVQRHQPLRTVFAINGNSPVQTVKALGRFDLSFHDLSGIEATGRTQQASRILADEVDRPFDLTRDLMLRATLLKLGDQEHQFMLTMHHIASDGWSIDVLSGELERLYRHYRNPADNSPGIQALEPLPITYVDYAYWQRESLSGNRLERLLAYWRQELEGLPSLELPADRPRPSMSSYRGSRIPIDLPEELITKLESLSQRLQVTMQMLLLAAFETLLFRYSNQADFAVGIPFAGRDASQLEGLIGFFVSTLVIRADLNGDPTFEELLSRVKQKSLMAYDHQDLPLQVLLADLQPERHLSRPPLFQVMFQLLNRSEPILNLDGVEVIEEDFNGDRIKFDLEMHLSKHRGCISGALYYSLDLFDRARIERMAQHFVQLLESVVENPLEKVSELSILTQQERRQLLLEFNDTICEYPGELCVHELFERQVERTPNAVALVFENQSLTYAELNDRANRLARYLRSQGVGSEARVGLCLERSLDLVVSILGILKAGAAYVPLDAEYPEERLETMMRLAGIKYLVTQSKLRTKLPMNDRLIISIDQVADQISGESPANLQVNHDSSQLAYVMFTSGSTGVPKGVMIEHRSIARLVFQSEYASFDSSRVFLQLAPISFDASTFELWGALLHGARLVIAPTGFQDVDELERWISNNGITTLWLTSSLFNQVVDQNPRALTGLSELLIGGEALSVNHVEKAMEVHKESIRIVNGYGPTESTTFACCFRIPNAVPLNLCSVPIGSPIANTQAYVLDAARELVPIGVPGELYIGGEGLARGYLDRPDLTAERFVSNPFTTEPDSKLYRTGDLCCWRADGTLDFLGRIDHQIKLRGFRIELGEIELILGQHPDISQCVVSLREDRPGDKRLVAYFVPEIEGLSRLTELREFLSMKLPEYMIPSAFVRLDVLPLTPTGKIDRQSLPAPDTIDFRAEEPYVPPSNPIQQQLAQIWSDVLGTDRIGIYDNFFAMGGHSLLAVKLFGRIQQVFGKKLPLSILFQGGTIAQLAELLSETVHDQPIATMVQLSKNRSGIPLIVMPGLNGELLYAKKLVHQIENRFCVVGLQPNLDQRFSSVYSDHSQTANEYLKILLEHQPQGPYRIVGYSYGGVLGFEIARLLEQNGHVVDYLGIIDTGPDPIFTLRRPLSAALHLFRVAKNLPAWVIANSNRGSFSKLVRRARRRLGYLGRWFRTLGRTDFKFEDEFGVKKSHDARREILGQLYQSFCRYEPKSYGGVVTLFRSTVRPLFHCLSPDLGWATFAKKLKVHPVPGDHDSILRPEGIECIAQAILQDTNQDSGHVPYETTKAPTI